MKQQLNEIRRMQQLAGIQINENLEPDFKQKAEDFIDKNRDIIGAAINFYEESPDNYEDNLIQTIYNFLEQELGEDWTTQISEPSQEDIDAGFNYGWTDEKDEVFTNTLKSVLGL
jgi:hypothetical protein